MYARIIVLRIGIRYLRVEKKNKSAPQHHMHTNRYNLYLSFRLLSNEICFTWIITLNMATSDNQMCHNCTESSGTSRLLSEVGSVKFV